jgi:hypothetical protein
MADGRKNPMRWVRVQRRRCEVCGDYSYLLEIRRGVYHWSHLCRTKKSRRESKEGS